MGTTSSGSTRSSASFLYSASCAGPIEAAGTMERGPLQFVTTTVSTRETAWCLFLTCHAIFFYTHLVLRREVSRLSVVYGGGGHCHCRRCRAVGIGVSSFQLVVVVRCCSLREWVGGRRGGEGQICCCVIRSEEEFMEGEEIEGIRTRRLVVFIVGKSGTKKGRGHVERCFPHK